MAKGNYKKFEDAREFVRSLKFSNRKNYFVWARSDKRLKDIPVHPNTHYKAFWDGWGDWLGTGKVANQTVVYREFNAARNFARTLGLKSSSDWGNYAKTDKRPKDIPANPSKTKQYKEFWDTWGDWLGNDTDRRKFRNFSDARALVRSLNIENSEKYKEYCDAEKIPRDIPKRPGDVKQYEKDWVSWADWLGIYSKWTKKALLGFVKSLAPIIDGLDPSELYSIAKNNNLISIMKTLDNDSPIKQTLEFLLANDKENAKKSIESLDATDDDILLDIKGEEVEPEDDGIFEAETNLVDEIIEENDDLPEIQTKAILNNLDHIEKVMGVSDEETAEFLINKALGRIWSKVLREDALDEVLLDIKNHQGQEYASTLQKRFLAQYEGANNLVIPKGYDFKIDGEPIDPNLMQRLIAYRLSTDKRIGNWSGTGAGKTLGAILAAECIQSKLTLIIGLNNTIMFEDEGWAKEIKDAFPKSKVHIKQRENFNFKPSESNYLLLNYESFQLNDSRLFIDEILENYQIDLVVLDEIHSAKSKDNILSKRRQLINYLLTEASNRNPDLHILGMSATPVVNSLDEAVSLIEMIKGKAYKELDTTAKISSALAIHEQLVINGIRYMPKYKMQLIEKEIPIEDPTIKEDLLKVGKGQVLQMEQVLLEAKLATIKSLLKPGTIIFSYYVEKIFPKLVKLAESCGYRVSAFNGEDKTGVKDFIEGRADILVGSAALGTGVNGLQYVCNRMILITLPWTSSSYEQLVGRIYRQGSKFNQIEIFIPQVTLKHKDQDWSWDQQRFKRIKYKKTLADAAVDGIVPEANLINQSKMLNEAREALNQWVTRLVDGELREINRPLLEIPLPPEVFKKNITKYGDFSLMNQRINSAKSATTHERFNKDPEEWYQYHTEYSKAREGWTEIPFEIFAERIKKREDWVVGDFGCGEALLSQTIRNKVYSFDHVAINPSVIACDVSKIDLPDEVLDVSVFSLSLMGVNWIDYLKEAFRLTRAGGQLMIAEPQNRWADEKLYNLTKGIVDSGFLLVGEPNIRNKFIYINAHKPI
jgi:hypothetical protein